MFFFFQISRTFQDSPVYSSTFQTCANPVTLSLLVVTVVAFANSLDPDQDRQKFGPDLSKLFDTLILFLK